MESVESFGSFVERRRHQLGKSLRGFCRANGEDAANWSKMERGVLAPPKNSERLRDIAEMLELDDSALRQMSDLAYAENGRVPPEIMNDEQLVRKLPVLFRTMRGDPPSDNDLREIASIVRRELSDE